VNTVAETPRASRTGPLAVVLLAQAAALVSLVPWVLVAGFSFLSFSAGVAESRLLPAPLLFALWAYPLLAVACAALTWRAWRRGDARAAVRWSSVELAAAAVVLGFVGFMISPVG
jgi:cytochrome bd-type quinol oxidase subunit 2